MAPIIIAPYRSPFTKPIGAAPPLPPRAPPGGGELRRGDALRARELTEPFGELQIVADVLGAEARHRAPHVVRLERVLTLDGAGEGAARERTVRDVPDAELAAGGQDVGLVLAAPERELRLHRGGRMHLVGGGRGRGPPPPA